MNNKDVKINPSVLKEKKRDSTLAERYNIHPFTDETKILYEKIKKKEKQEYERTREVLFTKQLKKKII